MMRKKTPTAQQTAQIIRFPRGGEPAPSASQIKPSDRMYLGIEVFRGGTYLGTALRAKSGLQVYDAMNEHVGAFANFDTAVDALFTAALD